MPVPCMFVMVKVVEICKCYLCLDLLPQQKRIFLKVCDWHRVLVPPCIASGRRSTFTTLVQDSLDVQDHLPAVQLSAHSLHGAERDLPVRTVVV